MVRRFDQLMWTDEVVQEECDVLALTLAHYDKVGLATRRMVAGWIAIMGFSAAKGREGVQW